MIVALLILVVAAIVFPRLVRFVLTLAAFGLLFVVASCIDHAKAAEPSQSMIDNAIAFSNCARGNAVSASSELHKISKLGGDVVTPLIMSCSTLVDSYVHFCQASGYAEDRCFGDLKVIVEDVLKQTPH
jgi:hypothetical protein